MQIVFGKVEAAKRQLESAIELWFADGDEISIAALAFNAAALVDDLCKKSGKNEFRLAEVLKHSLDPNQIPKWLTKGRVPANFLKHADRDASDQIIYETGYTRWPLLLASYGLETLGETPSRVQIAYRYVIALEKPALCQGVDLSQAHVEFQVAAKMGKKKLLETILDMIERKGLAR